MKTPKIRPTWLLAPLALLLIGARAGAASNGIHDEAHFFSADAVAQAERVIQQIEQKHHKDVLIDTLEAVPSDQKAALAQQGTEPFFERWANQRAQSQGVDGVYILIVREPGHLQIMPGNKTRQRLFPLSDRDAVRDELLSAFKQKQYDQGLIQTVQSIQRRMDANDRSAGSSSGSGTVVPRGGSSSSGGGSPGGNYPSYPAPKRSWGIGGLACLIIGVVLIIMLVRGIFGRSGGAGGYYGGQPGGGYNQGGYPQGGYPPQGGYGYGGGGGGGFGRGFLGGLLGGAVGGYAADKFMHPGQQGGGYVPPATGGGGDFGGGGGGGADTSFDSTGGGGDFGGGGSGADLGGGGGGDFGGGGGGDFGGGGGGDSGGGGGDF